MTRILEVRGLRVRYGAIEAVKGVSMTVGHAEIVTLIGGNGAGKTTTLKSISSVLRPAAGEIVFEGERTDRLPADAVGRRGRGAAPRGRGERLRGGPPRPAAVARGGPPGDLPGPRGPPDLPPDVGEGQPGD